MCARNRPGHCSRNRGSRSRVTYSGSQAAGIAAAREKLGLKMRAAEGTKEEATRMEDLLVALIAIGSIAIAAGWVLGMMGARKLGPAWLAGAAFVAIITLPVMAYKHPKAGKIPCALMIGGLVLALGVAAFMP
jgi:Zn-dependent membrane protease YugP